MGCGVTVERSPHGDRGHCLAVSDRFLGYEIAVQHADHHIIGGRAAGTNVATRVLISSASTLGPVHPDYDLEGCNCLGVTVETRGDNCNQFAALCHLLRRKKFRARCPEGNLLRLM